MNPTSLFLVLTTVLAASVSAKDFKAYLLAGQSNMEGFGYVNELPVGYDSYAGEVMIYHGITSADDEPLDGKGIWEPLAAGHGTGFTSDGEANTFSDRFGPELGFAKAMSAHDPDTPIALIKYARGGSSLDAQAGKKSGNWNVDYGNGAGINQYDHCLATIEAAFSVADIDGDGEMDRLVPAGILWMQGESDGHQLGPAYRYKDNLQELVTLFRAAMRDSDLPVVVGRISDSKNDPSGLVWEFGDVVRAQQAAYCEEDANAKLVTTTDDYAYSDKWHYDTAGFIDLGEQFAKAMMELQAE